MTGHICHTGLATSTRIRIPFNWETFLSFYLFFFFLIAVH